MDEEEYLELLAFTRAHLAQVGRPDIDEIAFGVAERAEVPSQIMRAYVESVTRQFELESSAGVRRAVSRAAEYVRVEQGRLTDILVAPTEGGEDYRRDPVPLSVALPDRSALIDDLRLFMRDLEHGFNIGGANE